MSSERSALEALLDAAAGAAAASWSPYSRFPVGAALAVADGSVVTGTNVENRSFGLTICAERAALVSAVAAGVREFRRIVVVSDSDPPASPCGACRQMLAEFGPALLVESIGPRQSQRWVLSELLPDAFTSHRLEAT